MRTLSDLLGISQRTLEPEIMDDPSLDPFEHERALRGLARLNLWTRTHRIVWRPVRDLALQTGRPVRVLDVATGSADIPIGLMRWARRLKLPIQVDACDRSAMAVAAARSRADAAGVRMHLFQLDALHDPIPGAYDIVMCSLFLHHLGEEETVTLLAKMREAAGAMVVVQDLVRSPAGLALTWLGTRTLTRSRVVHVDGMLSLRAAYTAREIAPLAEAAGLHGARLERRWPIRFLLTWRRLERGA